MGEFNTVLIIFIIVIAVIVAAWLIHFVKSINKTKRFYQEKMKELNEQKSETDLKDKEDKTGDEQNDKN